MTGLTALPRLFRRGRHAVRQHQEEQPVSLAIRVDATQVQAAIGDALDLAAGLVPQPAPAVAREPDVTAQASPQPPAAVSASPYQTGAAVLADHADWRYLTGDGPVRPPTDDEAQAYAARASDPAWASIYQPPDARDVLAPVAEPDPEHEGDVMALGQSPGARYAADDELVLDEQAQKALNRFLEAHAAEPVEELPEIEPTGTPAGDEPAEAAGPGTAVIPAATAETERVERVTGEDGATA